MQKYTLRLAQLELGVVDLDLAVEDDVLPLDRADMTQQVGVEREVRSGCNSRSSTDLEVMAHYSADATAECGLRVLYSSRHCSQLLRLQLH